MADYLPRWFTRPQTVTHPSINQARRRVTTLIETNALPLSEDTTRNPFIKAMYCVKTAKRVVEIMFYYLKTYYRCEF